MHRLRHPWLSKAAWQCGANLQLGYLPPEDARIHPLTQQLEAAYLGFDLNPTVVGYFTRPMVFALTLPPQQDCRR